MCLAKLQLLTKITKSCHYENDIFYKRSSIDGISRIVPVTDYVTRRHPVWLSDVFAVNHELTPFSDDAKKWYYNYIFLINHNLLIRTLQLKSTQKNSTY